jgi:hypothetical protein
VGTPPQDLRMLPSWRRLLTLVVGIVLCAWGAGDASASFLSAPGDDLEILSGHRCRCSACHDAENCCCGHRKSKAKAKEPTPAPTRRPAVAAAGLCMNSAPCGAPVVPVQGSRIVVRAMAILPGNAGRVPTTDGRWLARTAALSFISPFAARLDDPPEVSLSSTY